MGGPVQEVNHTLAGVLTKIKAAVFGNKAVDPLHNGRGIIPIFLIEAVISGKTTVIAQIQHPPGRIGRNLIHPYIRRGGLPQCSQCIWHIGIIAKQIQAGKNFRIQVAAPDQTVTLDAIPDLPILTAKLQGIACSLNHLIEQIIIGFQVTLPRKIRQGVDTIDITHCHRVISQQLNSGKPEATLTVGNIRHIDHIHDKIPGCVMIGGILFTNAAASLRQGFAQCDPHFCCNIPHKTGHKAHTAAQLLAKIQHHIGTFFLKAGNAIIGKGYISRLGNQKFPAIGNIAGCLHRHR